MKISLPKLILLYLVGEYNNFIVEKALVEEKYFLLYFIIRKKERINFLCSGCQGLILTNNSFNIKDINITCKRCKTVYDKHKLKKEFISSLPSYLCKFIIKRG